MSTSGFQRARTAEQQQARRDAILVAARTSLAEHALADISLRELSRRVGLSKSNVVRYFPTREAVFLAVLAEDWGAWLDDVGTVLAETAPAETAPAGAAPAGGGHAHGERGRHAAVARIVAESLARHERFCELLSSGQAVLERNVDVDTARWFKQVALDHLARFGELVGGRVPSLTARQRFELAGITWIAVAGAWPATRPGPAVAEALTAPHLAPLAVDLETAITITLTAVLDGMTRP